MKIVYSKQFAKDVKKYPELKNKVFKVIETFRQANSLSELKNIKKLQGSGNFFRIKIGNFRVGFSYSENTIVFKRFLHRKDMYKYFP
ncbi:MAG: type II toxin-antitoxin system RelE family toxin [Bacteroidota bacterium]